MAGKLLTYLLVLVAVHSLDQTLHQHATLLTKGSYPLLQQGVTACASYMCKPANMTMSPNTCLHFQNNTYYLQSCAQRTDGLTYCPTLLDYQLDDNQCQKPVPEQPGYLYPGEKCSSNSSCVNNICSESTGLCVGLNQGVSCIYSGQCAAGLFCNDDDGYCVPQKNAGDSCALNEECSNSQGCNKTMGQTGVCLPYFSVPVGGFVDACYGSSSYFCATGTCEMGNFGKGICISPIVSNSPLPMTCHYDSDCVGTSGSLSFQSSCQCGYTTTGTAYCYPFLGDSVGQDYLYYWTRLVQTGANQQCNTQERFSLNCLKSLPAPWNNAALAYFVLFQNYPFLQENDSCVKAIYTDYYWQESPLGVAELLQGLFQS